MFVLYAEIAHKNCVSRARHLSLVFVEFVVGSPMFACKPVTAWPGPVGGESGTRKVLKRAISGKLSAALAETSPTTAAGDLFGNQPIDRRGLAFAQLDFGRARRHHRGPDAADRRFRISIVDCDCLAGQVGDRLDVGTRHEDGHQCIQRRIQGRDRHSFRVGGGGRHLLLCRSGLRNVGR